MLGLYELTLVQLNIFMYNTLPQFSSYLPAAFQSCTLGHVVQSVMVLAADTCLTADPEIVSSIPARSHTFLEIDHEIVSMVIILPSADSRRVDVSHMQKCVPRVLFNWLVKLAQANCG